MVFIALIPTDEFITVPHELTARKDYKASCRKADSVSSLSLKPFTLNIIRPQPHDSSLSIAVVLLTMHTTEADIFVFLQREG